MPKPQINSREQRKQNRFRKNQEWIIFCDGEKTEVNYLKSLNSIVNNYTTDNKGIHIAPIPVRQSGMSLVKHAIAFLDHNKAKMFDNKFVVFDKDDLDDDNFNNAICLAKNNDIIPLWSNECFELWFILHYEFYTATNSRLSYFEKMEILFSLPDGYANNHKSDDWFSKIYSEKSTERLKVAIKNAKKLEELHENITSYAKKKPCTKMYELIEKIENELGIKL